MSCLWHGYFSVWTDFCCVIFMTWLFECTQVLPQCWITKGALCSWNSNECYHFAAPSNGDTHLNSLLRQVLCEYVDFSCKFGFLISLWMRLPHVTELFSSSSHSPWDYCHYNNLQYNSVHCWHSNSSVVIYCISLKRPIIRSLITRSASLLHVTASAEKKKRKKTLFPE